MKPTCILTVKYNFSKFEGHFVVACCYCKPCGQDCNLINKRKCTNFINFEILTFKSTFQNIMTVCYAFQVVLFKSAIFYTDDIQVQWLLFSESYPGDQGMFNMHFLNRSPGVDKHNMLVETNIKAETGSIVKKILWHDYNPYKYSKYLEKGFSWKVFSFLKKTFKKIFVMPNKYRTK